MERVLRKKLPGGDFKDVPPQHAHRMAAIRGRGNKTTEARLRALLVRSGIRGWKLQPRGFSGSPDFYFPTSRLMVFVDGCFWHGCPQCGHVPSVNRSFWLAKIRRNQERDEANGQKLTAAGFRVLRFWEHELQGTADSLLQRLKAML
jgi:DNA mismatch endonuclease Vsr